MLSISHKRSLGDKRPQSVWTNFLAERTPVQGVCWREQEAEWSHGINHVTVTPTSYCIQLAKIFLKKKFILIFNPHPRTCLLSSEKGEGREGERERNTHVREKQLPLTGRLTGDRNHNPGMRPDQGSSWQPFGLQDDAPTNSATQARAHLANILSRIFPSLFTKEVGYNFSLSYPLFRCDLW